MERIQPPAGSLTEPSLMAELGIARPTIQMMVARLRARGMDVLGEFWSRAGEASYILREGAEAIRAQSQKAAPDGWVPCSQFGKALTDIARSLYAEHPEYCEFFRDPKSGKLFLHYAPAFLGEMEKTEEGIGAAVPEQDIRAGELRTRLGAAGVLLKHREDEAIVSAAEAQKIMEEISGQLREGMEPDTMRRTSAIALAAKTRRQRRMDEGMDTRKRWAQYPDESECTIAA